ncbi:histidine--tRNA ligase [Symbiobacterium thermophilum]|uniref:histidine--tRNA ligase n=1 Tax=Symbiobacterium thermophilum TaxID=2734 RepID=UPI0035C68150
MSIQAPRGFNDILPGEQYGWRDSYRWQRLEEIFREVARLYGYQELRPPMVEYVDLFIHGVGATTDIVTKEMFNITPRGDDPDARRMAMRPEFTAGLVRAWLENGLYNNPQPTKIFAYGPAFRYENVQKGRFRGFHQLDVEVFGAQDPAVDAEVIKLGLDVVARLGLTGLVVSVNSIGCPQCRPRYRQALQDHFRPHLGELCEDCNTRFEKNPLRLLDCKRDADHPAQRTAPVTLDYLCDDCRRHWEGLLSHLAAMRIPYQIDTRIVRGLDYYTKTVFEVLHPKLGAQSALWGGGRYDGLIEIVGGKPTPGVGFGMGMERVLMVLEEEGLTAPFADRPRLDVFVATLGEAARPVGLKLLYALRDAGLSADIDYLGRSLKAQMKYAGKQNSRYVVILGEDEVRQGVASVKHMDEGTQESVPLDQIISHLRRAEA